MTAIVSIPTTGIIAEGPAAAPNPETPLEIFARIISEMEVGAEPETQAAAPVDVPLGIAPPPKAPPVAAADDPEAGLEAFLGPLLAASEFHPQMTADAPEAQQEPERSAGPSDPPNSEPDPAVVAAVDLALPPVVPDPVQLRTPPEAAALPSRLAAKASMSPSGLELIGVAPTPRQLQSLPAIVNGIKVTPQPAATDALIEADQPPQPKAVPLIEVDAEQPDRGAVTITPNPVPLSRWHRIEQRPAQTPAASEFLPLTIPGPLATLQRLHAVDLQPLSRALPEAAATLSAFAVPEPVAPLSPETAARPIEPMAFTEALDPSALVVERELEVAQDGEWLDQLAKDISRAAGGEGGLLRFRLNPEHLGRLDVQVTQDRNGAAVRITADNQAAQTLLTDAQPRLVAEARAQGLRISETHVDLGQQGSGDARRQYEAEDEVPIRTARLLQETEEGDGNPTPPRSERYA